MFGKKKESINGFTQQALELAKAQVRKQIDDTPFFKYGDNFYMVFDQIEWYDSKMVYYYKGVRLFTKDTNSTGVYSFSVSAITGAMKITTDGGYDFLLEAICEHIPSLETLSKADFWKYLIDRQNKEE